MTDMAPEKSVLFLATVTSSQENNFFLPSSPNSQLSGQEFRNTLDEWKSYKQMPVAGRQEGCNRLSKQKKQKNPP